MDFVTRYSQARFTALLGAAKNLLLAALKIIFGLTGNSYALVADGVHSLADLLTDGLVLVATRFGSRAADHNHPYGHGRIETAGTMLLALILIITGAGIIYHAGEQLWGGEIAAQPDVWVFIVTIFSIVLNEGLFFVTKNAGKKLHSQLLIANAWHHRSDSASSLVVLIGIAGAWAGYVRLDAVAALVVGLMIIHMAWYFGWASIRELVDTALDDEIVNKIKNIISTVPGVAALHQLRTRSIGGMIVLDVHILVKPTLSVSEGHFIGQQVHYTLTREMVNIKDVTVHIDPEDDEAVMPSINLITRSELLDKLKERWQNLLAKDVIENVVLHYLNGKIHIEVRLSMIANKNSHFYSDLQTQLQNAITDLPGIHSVKLLFVINDTP